MSDRHLNDFHFVCIEYKLTKTKKPQRLRHMKRNLVTTYSPVPAIGTVPSARAGLTSLFGMGRGVSPPL
jgi:hypothetical protein